MNNLFFQASSFNQDIGDWNISRISDLSSLFFEASAFNQDISRWDTSSVTSMSNMFSGAISFNQDIGDWNTSRVEYMSAMFKDAQNFNHCIKEWDVHLIVATPSSFADNSGLHSSKVPEWGTTSGVCPPNSWTDLGNGFYVEENNITINCDGASVAEESTIQHNGKLFTKIDVKTKLITHGGSVDASNACTSGVTDMSRWFANQTDFDKNISHWDTSSVTNMSQMFRMTTHFNQDIGDWNVSNVLDISGMFAYTDDFNQSISRWDVSKVTNMRSTFQHTHSFNQDISNWNVSSVTNMTYMFANTYSFNQDIGDWNVSNVLSMDDMFSSTKSFNQDISRWDVSKVTDMSYMFTSAESFNQDISNWNVSRVTAMVSMFQNTVFDQDISSWDVTNVSEFYLMFYGNSALSIKNECKIIKAWNKSEAYANDTMAISGNTSGFSMEQCLPTSLDKNITVALDGNYTFALSDFYFNDPMGATLAYIYITTTPTHGDLTLSGSSIIANQKINSSNITALLYTPNRGSLENDYFSFIVNSSDDVNSSNEYNISRVVDTTPDPFTFASKTNQEFDIEVTSSSATIQGMDDGTAISITNGEYSINGGAYTSTSGTIDNGQSVTVKTTSANNYSTKVTATLTVGTVNATFDVTTKAAPPSNAKPTLKGLSDTININDTQTINPFSSTEVDDANGNDLIVELSLDSNKTGSLTTYRIEGSIDDVQSALRAISFSPIENIAPVGENNITTITIEVSDGKDTTTATVDINTTSINNAPQIKTVLNDEQITLGSTQTFNIEIADRDYDDLNLSITSDNPQSASVIVNFTNPIVDADYSLNTFSVDVKAMSEGNSTITLTLTDGNLSTSQSFRVEVPAVVEEPSVENNETDTTEEGNSTSNTTDPTTENNNTSSDTTGSSDNNTTTEDNTTEPTTGGGTVEEENNNSTPSNEEPQEDNSTQEPLTFIQVVGTVAKFNEKLDVEISEDDKKQEANITTPDGKTIHIEVDKISQVAKITLTNPTTGKSKTFSINLKGSQTYIDEEGNVVVTTELGNGAKVTNTIKQNGTVEHRVNHKDKETKAHTAMEDANTTVDVNGTVTTEAQIEHEGFIYRAIVTTDSQGNSKTKFVKINTVTGEQIDLSHTLRSDMSFEHGSTIEIMIINNKVHIKTKTPLHNDLVIE